MADVCVIGGGLAGLSAAGATAAADRWIEELVLARWARTGARKLSLGNRQRLGLAAALIAEFAASLISRERLYHGLAQRYVPAEQTG